MAVTFILATLSAGAGLAQSRTIALAASADTTLVRVPGDDHPRGSEAMLAVGGEPEARILVRFDADEIAAVLDGASLVRATLELRLLRWDSEVVDGEVEGLPTAYSLAALWSERGATWNCAADLEPSSGVDDCPRLWKGGPVRGSAARAELIRPATISIDVTTHLGEAAAESAAARAGWLVAGSQHLIPRHPAEGQSGGALAGPTRGTYLPPSPTPLPRAVEPSGDGNPSIGRMEFSSRETCDRGPRLILEVEGGAEDRAPPRARISLPEALCAVDGEHVLRIDAFDPSGVEDLRMFFDGAERTASCEHCGDTGLRCTFDSLAPGSHEIRALARDAAGNEGITTQTLEVSTSGLTVVLPLAADTTLHGAASSDTAGVQDSLGVGGAGDSGAIDRAVLRVAEDGIRGLVNEGRIGSLRSALLELEVVERGGDWTGVEVELHELQAPFEERSATWACAAALSSGPCATPWEGGMSRAGAIVSASPGPVGSTLRFELGPSLGRLLELPMRPILGWLLRASVEGTAAVRFGSREHLGSSPRLVLDLACGPGSGPGGTGSGGPGPRPVILSLSPPDGTLTVEGTVTIEGRVRHADEVFVDGTAADVAGGGDERSFRAGPLPLAEGSRTFVVTARNEVAAIQALLDIERDSRSPSIVVVQPGEGAVLGFSPVEVVGTAHDPHLERVLVDGRLATLDGAAFRLAGLALSEGENTVRVEAFDRLGNGAAAPPRGVVLDTVPPRVEIHDGNAPLVEGMLANRPVVPTVVVVDATATTVEIRLDGAPFVSGSAVGEDGSHRLGVLAVDAAGNVTSREVSFRIDQTSPRILEIAPTDDTLLGSDVVTVEVQTEGADAVSVAGRVARRVGGQRFRAAGVPLAEGSNLLTVAATDEAGNSTSVAHRVRSDTLPPAISVAEPVAGAVLGHEIIGVSGTASDLHLARVLVNGVLANLAGSTFTVARLALGEGANVLGVEACDAVENCSRTERQVTVDTIPPMVRILDGPNELAADAELPRPVTLVFEAIDATATTLSATVDGASFASGGTVARNGRHEVVATAADAAGNQTTRELSFRIDTRAPVFVEISPVEGHLTAAAQVSLSGRVVDASEVTVDGVMAELAAESFVAGPFDLAEGEHVFTLVARDALGNSSTERRRIVRDATPPAVQISEPVAGSFVASLETSVGGTVEDPHLTIVELNGTTAILSGSTWRVARVPLNEGSMSLVATARDGAGNVGTARSEIVVDATPPSVLITEPAGGARISGATTVVRGLAADLHLERVELDGQSVDLAAADPTTPGAPRPWSVETELDEGTNTLTARAFDLGGRSVAMSVEVERDSSAPDVEIVTPPPGAVVNTPVVEVQGEVDAEDTTTVTVGGIAAEMGPVETGSGRRSFVAREVPLVEGENRLRARAVDGLGNAGVASRLVILDTVPPELLGSDPASGASSLPLAGTVRLTFSEPLATAGSGSVRLETGDGESLMTVLAMPSPSEIEVRPESPFPSGASVRLHVTEGLADEAGNPLVNPQTLDFGIADAISPSAPRVEAVESPKCESPVTVQGEAEAGGRVEIRGGVGVVQTLVGVDGRFAVDVALLAESLNVLRVVVTDIAGNVSPPAELAIVHDCTPPRVVLSELVEVTLGIAGGVEVHFSEPVAPSTVQDAVTVSDASGPLPAALAVEPTAAVWTPLGALPAGGLRLDVSTAVRDLAGNALAFPFTQLFGGGAADSFFVGTVIDDAIGRPLPGAVVRVLETDGVSLAEPRPGQTSDARGRFQVPIASGTHLLAVERSGYTPSFRRVTTSAGAGSDVFDPRLTPASPAVRVGDEGGSVSNEAGVLLSVPPGAFAAEVELALSAVDEQGLPALLPYGWSPRGAVWIEVAGVGLGPAETAASFDLPLTLGMPVTAPEGTLLALLHLELSPLQWRVHRLVAVEDGRVDAAVSEPGGWAAVQADSGVGGTGGVGAPPPPLEGEVLVAAPSPRGTEIVAARLGFEPPSVLPSQRALATVRYDVAGAAPSGMALTLTVAEELTLVDQSRSGEDPYRADLVLYTDAGGEPGSRFWLQPSTMAAAAPLDFGVEDVTIEPFASTPVSGNVLGVGGGSVTSSEGDRVTLPGGALVEPVAVRLERRRADEVDLPVPPGTSVLGVLHVDLSGTTLARPAELFLVADPPAGSERGLLLQVVDLGTWRFFRPVADLEGTAEGWITRAFDPFDPDDLPWPGVVEGGTFVFVRADEPVAFVHGAVLDVGATRPVPGALIHRTSGTSSAWIQIAHRDPMLEGLYVLPVLGVGAAELIAEDLPSGDRAHGTIMADADGERLRLDLALQIVRPEVMSTTPEAGAVDVPPGVEPVVLFSEAVDRATLSDGIELGRSRDSSTMAVDFDHDGAVVTVLPQSLLVPGEGYTLRIGNAIRDLHGNALLEPVEIDFTVRASAASTVLDLSRVFLVKLDAPGAARVRGLAGAVPVASLVTVERHPARPGAVAVTTSGEAEADGSFEIDFVAEILDTVLLRVLVPNGGEIIAELTPFRTDDLQGAFVDERGVEFTTADGITVTAAAGTFEVPTAVRVTATTGEPQPVPPPPDFALVAALRVDFTDLEGRPVVAARRGLGLRLPAPRGLSGDGPFLLMRLVRALGADGWMLHDLLQREGDVLIASDGADAGITAGAAGAEGEGGVNGAQKAVRWSFRDRVPGVAFPGTYQVHDPAVDLDLVSVPLQSNEAVVMYGSFDGVVARIDAGVERLLDDHAVLLPVRRGPFTLEIRDLTSGNRLFEETFELPSADPGEVTELPPDALGDDVPPFPVGGSPLRFFALELGSEASTTDLDRGIQVDYDGQAGSLRLVIDADAADPDVEVRLIGLDVDYAATSRTAADGSLELERIVPEGRVLVAVGARLSYDDEVVVDFSEPLDAAYQGLAIHDEAGRDLGITPLPVGTRDRIRLRPETHWALDAAYTLHLGSELQDDLGNRWGRTLEVEFQVMGPREVDDRLRFEAVRDTASLGSWLFVAADRQGLHVLDTSDPHDIHPVVPGTSWPFPLGDPVAGVDVDPHGRVLVVGGGVQGFGQMKIFDPLAVDVETMRDNDQRRLDAYQGSTLLSDPNATGDSAATGTPLLSGRPQKVRVLSSDVTDEWRAGEAPADSELVVTPATPPSGDGVFALTVSGRIAAGGEAADHPVTLRDRTRGSWARTLAGDEGRFAVTLEVESGDELLLLRNNATVAYVATLGIGVQVVDVNAFFREAERTDPSLVQSDVITQYHGAGDPSLRPCGEPVSEIGGAVLDVDYWIAKEPSGNPVLTVATLLAFKGLLLLDEDLADLRKLSVLGDVCAELEGSRAVSGFALVRDYPFDLDGDGKVEADEWRDYALVAHRAGAVLVIDLSDRGNPEVVGVLRLAGSAAKVAVDRERRLLFVSTFEDVVVADFDRPPTLLSQDRNHDGSDDRILARTDVAGTTNLPVHLVPDLGIALVGSLDHGLTAVAVARPRLRGVAPAADGRDRRVGRVAPFGVPTARWP